MDERVGFKNKVAAYLKTLEPDVFWEKRWGGGIYTKSGVADFTGAAYGVPFALEIKHPNGKGVVSSDQAAYSKRVTRAGGLTAVADNLPAVQSFFEWIKQREEKAGRW